MADVTRLLQAAEGGCSRSRDEAIALIYDELHGRAERLMRRERDGHTLSATDLLHAAYIKLVGERKPVEWDDRRHFFRIAAKRMRQILVDHARRHRVRVTYDEELRDELRQEGVSDRALELDVEVLNEVLESWENGSERFQRLAEVIELKYFGGMKNKEVAEQLGVDPQTVYRHLRTAHMFLLDRIA